MEFDSKWFGEQQYSVDDREYRGSIYSKIREEMFHNAYYQQWGADGEPPLPTYDVSWGRVVRGILPFGSPWKFRQATARAVDSDADMRWGPDRRGFRRLLHPNGVCLFGRWIIDQPSPWSGYFQQGSEALIVGRYSTCCGETRRGHNRSLSLVGKLFPTTDENYSQPLRTANFITQEDLGGSNTPYINDVVCRNAPDVTPWRRGLGTPILLLTGLLFKLADREPAIRQLYPIAELGKPAGESTRTPQFMQLTVDKDQPRIEGEALDFRNEVISQIRNSPFRKLVFNIEATDAGARKGVLVQRRTFPEGWQRIGRIEFHEAVASYNGDFVVHFPHPPWRTDDNDPQTVLRKGKQHSQGGGSAFHRPDRSA